MDLGFVTTVTLLILTLALFLFCRWKEQKPADILRPRLINYGIIQVFCVILILLLGVHVITLIMGRPVTGTGDINHPPQ